MFPGFLGPGAVGVEQAGSFDTLVGSKGCVFLEEVGERVDFGPVFLGVGAYSLGHLEAVLLPGECSGYGPGEDGGADLWVVSQPGLEGWVAFRFRDCLCERELQDAPRTPRASTPANPVFKPNLARTAGSLTSQRDEAFCRRTPQKSLSLR